MPPEQNLNPQPPRTKGPVYQSPGSDYVPPPPPPPYRGGRSRSWRSVVSTLFLFLLAPAIALFIAAFVVQSYQVDGQSMEPTLQDNDRLIVDKWQRSWARITKHDYIPRRGDIVIFNQGLDFASGVSKQLIKRVVALPGERVVVKDGKITVYNQERSEGFDPDTLGLYDITVAAIVAPPIDVTLGPNEVYVVGDNRANSEDSRYFGPIKAEKIVGKLAFRIVPLDKAQRF